MFYSFFYYIYSDVLFHVDLLPICHDFIQSRHNPLVPHPLLGMFFVDKLLRQMEDKIFERDEVRCTSTLMCTYAHACMYSIPIFQKSRPRMHAHARAH
jgi:hypothetical protein